MAPIVWLASYPKSGNTWMRALLTNYLADSVVSADINTLDGGPIASDRVWFDEWAGVEASALPEAVVDRLRPDVYRCLAAATEDTLYMKVHDAWTVTDRGGPMFPADVTQTVVYIVRNPLDLAASCAHHWGVGVGEAVERMCQPGWSMREGGAPHLPMRLGAWSEHVRSWLDESGLPIHIVRYEDLLRDPESSFAAVVSACGLDVEERRLRQAVAFSSFAELRRQEEANGFRERSARAPGPFFRRGEAGAWTEELEPELVGRLISAHGETMERLGYEIPVPSGGT